MTDSARQRLSATLESEAAPVAQRLVGKGRRDSAIDHLSRSRGRRVWAGIDSGKRAHHCAVIDTAGRTVVSRRVANDEAALLELIASVLALAGGDQVVWATDLNAGGAALLIALRRAPISE